MSLFKKDKSACNTKVFAVCGIVENENKILLVRHTYGTAKDRILLPGGYVKENEIPTISAEREILEETGVNPDTRVKDLTEDDISKIRDAIDKDYTVEGDLRRQTALDIKSLMEIGCYRGLRHRKGLPCRGQRTKTNARTRKGPKKTIANKKK